ncbi:UNVERIFIED_CONTAM: hypothetical protein FKN15_004209 [Acipenser sinensis]
MIKTESKGDRTLRSASPHRNAYKSDFHAIKCSFDGAKPSDSASQKSYANGSSDDREDTRGRPFGTRINKIKNIFLQMDGQQNENTEVKIMGRNEIPAVSPPKAPLASSVPKTSPESPISDKASKSEDGEFDQVTLSGKFSETRKLFERGIKDQTPIEKHSPTKTKARVSLGSVSDDGKSPRHSSGSSENTVSSLKADLSPASLTKGWQSERSDSEGGKHHVCRLSSLNAGPISRRLENFMVDSDNEEPNRLSCKEVPETESQQTVHRPSALAKPTSPIGHTIIKPNIGNTSVSSPPFRDQKQTPSSLVSNSFNFQREESSKAGKADGDVLINTGSAKLPEQDAPLDHTAVGMVRAELVVVQNESSESDENEYENDVFEELKAESPKPDLRGHPVNPLLEKEKQDFPVDGKEVENTVEKVVSSHGIAREVQKSDSKVAEDYPEEDDGEEEGESEIEEQVESNSVKLSPNIYGIENAAFVDDKDTESEHQETEPKAEEEAYEEEYQSGADLNEIPGLSDEEDPLPRRKIKFSTSPIQMDGQQNENTEVKIMGRNEIPAVSPPKAPLASSVPKTSPESPISDKASKSEDGEFDQVTLSGKFSETRKLFERGIKDQTPIEKHSPTKTKARVSLGSVSDDGKSPRHSSGSSENTVSSLKADLSPASLTKGWQSERSDSEGGKHHVCRLSSLNAGPISRRLENFMVDSDNEEPNRLSCKEVPETESQQTVHRPSALAKPTSPIGHTIIKPNIGNTSVSSPPFRDQKQTPSSLVSNSFNFQREESSKAGKADGDVLINTGSAKLPEQDAPLDHTAVGMVRAELVVVQNESSESDENEYENDVFEELKAESPKPDLRGHPVNPLLEKEKQDFPVDGKEVENTVEKVVSSHGIAREVQKSDSKVAEDYPEEDDGEEEGESEIEEQVESNSVKLSPNIYGIENAAFVDDKDTESEHQETEPKAEEEAYEEEYQSGADLNEIPGLSDEEDPLPRRKIKFSTSPIQVF